MWRIARLFCSRFDGFGFRFQPDQPSPFVQFRDSDGALTLGHCVAIVWRFDMAIIIQEIIPRAAAIHRAMHANPLDGWGWGCEWEKRDVCGLRQRGISAWCILAWNERDLRPRGNSEHKTLEMKKKCVFYCNIDRHSTIANERAKPKTQKREQSGLRELRELRAAWTTLNARRYQNLLLSVGAGDGVSMDALVERVAGPWKGSTLLSALRMPWHFISILIRAHTQFGISFHLEGIFFFFLGNSLQLIQADHTDPSLCLSLIFIFNFKIFTLIFG